MAGIIDKITIIQKFLTALTWQKLAQLTVFLLVLTMAWATYDNRTTIYNFAKEPRLSRTYPTITKLSSLTSTEINKAVDKSDVIIAVQVVLVDFPRNVRVVAYSYTDNARLDNVYKVAESHSVAEIPLFNANEKNNKRMVDLINGEFVCLPFADTIGSSAFPDARNYISTTCSNGIPPYYGRFSGYINIYLSRLPTTDEVDLIRALSKRLSALIYEEDLS